MSRLGWQRRVELPGDLDADFVPLYKQCRPFTMTSAERLFAVYKAMQYLAAAEVPGDVVECGVWRGGSSMMAVLSAAAAGDTCRRAFLYDTFEGMTRPGSQDGKHARLRWEHGIASDHNEWCYAPLEDVRNNMLATGLDEKRLCLVKGPVESTLYETVPKRIALLRLDTDWYASTKVELEVLYPLLSVGGVLIIDDYGHWAGSRQAVDEFFGNGGMSLLFHRVDDTARVAVKSI
jgi:hypothetical protein